MSSIDRFQYGFGSGEVSPYTSGVVTCDSGFYSVCHQVQSADITLEEPDSISLSGQVLVLKRAASRRCLSIACVPDIASVTFSDSRVQYLGYNACGCREWRWYWDKDHPTAYVSFLLGIIDPASCKLCAKANYCFVACVVNPPAMYVVGSVDVTFSTGLISSTASVIVEATQYWEVVGAR